MKKSIFAIAFALLAVATFGQKKYTTRTGTITFFSDASLEDITAQNHQVTAVLKSDGKLAYKVPIKSFEFAKALMQEHFNENYMESDKYPEASYEGAIEDNTKVDYAKTGTYKVSVKGKLTMHGVTKDVTFPGEVVVDAATGKVTSKCVFKVALKDYNIKNDKVGKIADNIEITVNVEMLEKK